MRKFIGKLLIIVAIMVFVYPFVSKLALIDSNSEMTVDTMKMIEEASEEEKKIIEFEKEKYNTELLNGAFNAEGDIKDLNLPTVYLSGEKRKAIGVLYIPKLEEYIPIYMGTDDDILSVGVGIIKNTSIPGGKGTHSVISGHRGTHNAKLFRHLDDMEKGDEFFIFLNKETLKYEVHNIHIIQPNEADALRIDPNEDKVTLLTCTPYLINTERLLVEGDRVSVKEEDKAVFESKFKENERKANPTRIIRNVVKTENDSVYSVGVKTTVVLMGAILLLLILLLFILPMLLRKPRKKEEEEETFSI